MEPLSPVVVRRKTLTNPAAEFVEIRVDTKALYQTEQPTEEVNHLQDDTEFCPEIDRFASKGANLVVLECYSQSKKSTETFRETLKKFAAILRERGVDSRLSIVIKDPSEFTMEYILEIINSLGKSSDSPSKIVSCKEFIQSCYRKVADNK